LMPMRWGHFSFICTPSDWPVRSPVPGEPRPCGSF
jgi:hypothetical protein